MRTPLARNRIICIGNRYIAEDSLGMLVYDQLKQRHLPHDVAVIDGGLAGIDLLGCIEGADRVIFVDAMEGGAANRIHCFSADEITMPGHGLDHASSFQYLLAMLPFVMESPMPQIHLLAASGSPDANTICAAADRAIQMAGGDS